MSKLLTIKEAAILLRVHVITIYRMVNNGNIPALKVGKQWRFDKKKLLDSFEQKKNKKRRT